MKRLPLFVLGVLATTTNAGAQTAAETIERALAAAPGPARDGAAVINWNADGTYETIKEGSNRVVCWDWSGQHGFPLFAVTCCSVGSLESNAQFVQFLEAGGSQEETEALRAAARADGTRVRPEYGSVQHFMGGPDRASAQVASIIWVPGATTESIGLSDTPSQERAWIQLAGTADAHIIAPGP